MKHKMIMKHNCNSANNEEPEFTDYRNWVYIAMWVTPVTEYRLLKYCRDNLNWLELWEDFHVTLIFSKKQYDWWITVGNSEQTVKTKFKWFSRFWDNNNTLVIELESQELKWRNMELMNKYWFISDFEQYSPHITLTNNGKSIDETKLPEIDFDLILTNEYVEELELDDLDENPEDETNNYNDDKATEKINREEDIVLWIGIVG